MSFALSLAEIRATRKRLDDFVLTTPVVKWRSGLVAEALGRNAEVFLKLELLQVTGTFKPRGALTNLMRLGEVDRRRGVTTFSAGNHAAALAWAAREIGVTAKVVMPKTASPARIARCRAYGAEVILEETIASASDRVQKIQEAEGRSYVHPYEGEGTLLGTSTVGLELAEQVEDLDAVIVPVGGGGLIAGISAAVRQIQPGCRVYGVEPVGAPTIHASLEAGEPRRLEKVETIADSLGGPYAAPLGFELIKANVEEVALVTDEDLKRAMALMFHEAKLAVEPAGAAALAALLGPYRQRLAGKRTALVVCGTNIDIAGYARYLQEGEALAAASFKRS